MKGCWAFVFLIGLLSGVFGNDNEDATYWRKNNNNELKKSLNIVQNTHRAKNVILFIGDGMSLPTVTAGRIYKNQQSKDKDTVGGEETPLTFETFPHVGLSRTYNTDEQIPDSSSTASAMATGVKTNYGTMGFDVSIKRGSGESEKTASEVESILKWAQDAEKDTGLVTNTRVTHATPAAFYAHSADRDWECDALIPDDEKKQEATDIAKQAVLNDPGRRLKVLMGGGEKAWKNQAPQSKVRPNDAFDCARSDPTEDLTKEFLKKNSTVPGFEDTNGKYITNYKELKDALSNVDKFDYLLGLFGETYMKFDTEINKNDDDREPDLVEMTELAIKLLSKNKSNGFFLMIEGGLIDIAHHYGEANNALHETMMLDNAVEKALEMVDTKDTLIIVTADHGHTMSYSGYTKRGGDIRGFSDNLADDKEPYNLLSYANGIGFNEHYKVVNDKIVRKKFTEQQSKMPNYVNPATVSTDKEWHSGADVGIFATGPWSHLFHSVHEQSYINTVMAFSACLGEYSDETHCSSSGFVVLSTFAFIISLLFSQSLQ